MLKIYNKETKYIILLITKQNILKYIIKNAKLWENKNTKNIKKLYKI